MPIRLRLLPFFSTRLVKGALSGHTSPPTYYRSMSIMAEKSKIIAPYGTWKSPITADLLTQKNVSFGEITVTRQGKTSADIVFVENRPQESGRAALIKKTIDLKALTADSKEDIDLTRGKYNARSGVHEYGGGAMETSKEGQLIFTDYKTFGVYEVNGEDEPKELTAGNKAHRFADFTVHPKHPRFISVLEDHTIDEPAKVVNSIVCVKEDASVLTIVSGSDFYSNPRISPDGRFLTWVSWDHPSMPFFATELWVAELLLDAEGKTSGIGKAELIGTKGVDEVSQYPRWIDDSTIVYTNDNTGYNNLYKVQVSLINGGVQLSQPQLVCRDPLSLDFYSPAWTLNNSDFVVLGSGWLACVVKDKNVASISLVNIESGQLRTLKSPFVVISQLRALSSESVVFNGVQSNEPPAIVVMELSQAIMGNSNTPRWTTIKRSSELVEQGTVPRDYLTKAEAIEFPTELPDGTKTTAHAIILPPCNPTYAAPAGTLPPCIVKIHGGPTSAADAGLNLLYNYWTSRGYMICTVNYGGSTGYGREFMLRLDGQWGVVDVRDAVAAATYLGSDNSKQASNTKYDRAISAQGQRELDRLTENIMPSGAVEFTLDNPGSWSINLNDAILATTLSAVGALIPGLQIYHGLAAAGLAWLYSKMTHVQQESVSAIPGVGLQLTTTRGFTLPQSLSKNRESRFYTTSQQTKLIPRDCILDVMTNEAFRRWSVVDYIAVATRSPPGSSTTSRGGQLDVIFPNLLPRLPVVERVYRSIYPAIFGHEVPVSISSDQDHTPRADPNRMVISGGSAGGYTVLAALCLYPKAFSAGCSSYGVSDVAALDAESHKFESRYTERLMGGKVSTIPQVYHDRSPIFMADRIKSPVLFLQGDVDKVVPPEQSEGMYKILQKNGINTKYILFEGEGHGFRQAKNIKKALEEEEKWYRTCFDIKVDE